MSERSRLFRSRNDQSRLSKVGEARRRPWPPVRFYWCAYCGGPLLFASIGEGESDERPAGVFRYDHKTGAWLLAGPGRSPKESDLVQALAFEAGLPRMTAARHVGADEDDTA